PGSGYSSPDATETFTLFDVSTPLGALRASGSGQTDIFNDLGSGASFGSQTVSPTDNGNGNGKYVSVSLNDGGLAALNAARGGLAAVGGALTTLAGTADQYVFGSSSGAAFAELFLLVSRGDWYGIDVTSTANALRLETSTPADGPGLFGNGLNPRITLYDPSGALVASGLPLADGRNAFIQYLPTVTGTYRVCVVGEGTTSGEYF